MANDILSAFLSSNSIILECKMKVRRDYATFQIKECDMSDIAAFASRMEESHVRKVNKEARVSCSESLSHTHLYDSTGVQKQGRLRFHTASIALDMSFEIDDDNNITFTDHNTHENIRAKFTAQ